MSDTRDLGRTNWEACLIRSAHLDVPREGAKDRVLERVLQDSERTATARGRRGTVALSVLAAAAVPLVFWLSTRSRDPRPLELRPETPPPAASAVPTPSEVKAEPAPCPKLAVAPGREPLIDDFEDQNARLILAEGRDGTWAMYNDGTAPPVKAVNWPWHPQRLVPPRGASHYGLHVAAGKMETWGAVLTVDFAEGACYDVSAYGGVEFWGRGNTRVHLALMTIDWVPVEKGGLCAKDCFSTPAKPLDLKKPWTHYSVTWDDIAKLARPSIPFDPKRVVALNFGIYSQDTPFDIWIDDLRFLEKH